MTKPTSFRLDPSLLERLAEEADATGATLTSLVSSMLDEGLRTRRFPGIVYREGPAGRRAALAGGPDVWEIVRDIGRSSVSLERRVQRLAKQLPISERRIRLALDFYAAFPEEIDERIERDERAATEIRQAAKRRDRLLAG